MKKGRGYIKHNEETITKMFDELENWLNEDPNNLFMNEYFTDRGLGRQGVKELLILYPWLHERYDILFEKQQYKLLKAGLFREVDSGLTKFVLSSKYNWKDKTIIENEVTMKDFDIRDLVGFDDDKENDI